MTDCMWIGLMITWMRRLIDEQRRWLLISELLDPTKSRMKVVLSVGVSGVNPQVHLLDLTVEAGIL